jgi:hypothetical protein
MSDETLFKNKFLKYKNKYNKLKEFYKLFTDNYQTAGSLKRTNEYCYVTNKKFENDDLVSQCAGCNNWGLASKMIDSENCLYCNHKNNKKINDSDYMELLDVLERGEEDIFDKSIKSLKFNFNNNDDMVKLYNKRLLGDDKSFNKCYNDYKTNNNNELKELLLYNIHNLTEQIIPENFIGTFNYHNEHHNKYNKDNDDNGDNCLYCIYNKIL